MSSQKIDLGLVNRFLTSHSLPIIGTAEARVQRLMGHYIERGKAGEIQLALCDGCQCYSDAELQACPFCGDATPVHGVGEPAALTTIGEEEERLEPLGPLVDVLPERRRLDDYTVEDLDRVLAKCARHSRLAAEQIHAVGSMLALIRRYQLWRLRKNGKVPVYTGLYDCIEKEVGYKAAYAARLMAVAEQFTAEQVRELGVTKLYFSLRLQPEQRGEFLDRARALSAHDGKRLADTAKAVAAKTAIVTKPEKVEEREKPDFSTAVAHIRLGATIHPMWKRPTVPGAVGEPTTEARSIAEEPWTRLELGDDVWLSVRLFRERDGTIRAIVEFRRGREFHRGTGTGVPKEGG